MIQYEKFELENGLKVIVHKDKSTPIVCMNILYNVGARDEDENKTGFAHLFEHLMFGGSKNIPNYDEPLQKVGGTNNAFTTNNITNYYLTVPKSNIETAFWLESDRMLDLAFSDKSLEVQRSVVIEEFKQRYLNQPYGDVYLLLRPLAYKKHPYKWATIGKEIAHIENATMDDVKAFYKKFYNPNNAIMCIAGNVDKEEVELLTKKWFVEIEKGEKVVRNLPKELEQTSQRIMEVERDVPSDAIYIAFHMCDRYSKEYYVFDIISDILSRGKSSRFYERLVKQKKFFTTLDAYVTGDLDEGLFIVSGKIKKGVTMEEAEKAVFEELEKLQKEVITDYELEKQINKIISSNTFGEMSVLNKAMNLCYSELLGDIDLVNTEVENYKKITANDIQFVSDKYLQKNNSSILRYYSSKITKQHG